ncbi:MAG: hypothetical protein JW808_03045 [Victivallales bacterium]|nr:hypothetical protein [Victivallales bacterium]
MNMDFAGKLQVGILILAAIAVPVFGQTTDTAAPPDSRADAAVGALVKLLPAFSPVGFSFEPKEIKLTADHSFTIEHLRGVEIDPTFAKAVQLPDDKTKAEDTQAVPKRYVAQDIRPFRLDLFTSEFNWSGNHVQEMNNYAALHGFGVVVSPDPEFNLPPGTQKLQWHPQPFPDWPSYFEVNGIPWGRYDRFAERGLDTVIKDLIPYAPDPIPNTIRMLDIEEQTALLTPDKLREQEWYPSNGSEIEKQAFEKKYYQGYAMTYIARVKAMQRHGWDSVGIYPQLWGTGYWALNNWYRKDRTTDGLPVPGQDWTWDTFAKDIVKTQDVLYPDHYVYYATPTQVPYNVARNDYELALLKTLPPEDRRPFRPYFWPLLHGGDHTYYWWTEFPLPNEEFRAMFFFNFMSGADGLVLWNWVGFNPHLPRDIAGPIGMTGVTGVEGRGVQFGEDFELPPKDGIEATRFSRYDGVIVKAIEEEADGTKMVLFQRPEWAGAFYKKTPAGPVYKMEKDSFMSRSRIITEPVAGAVEGLALVKVVEPILRHGEVMIDIPAIRQFMEKEPLVRRVKLGDIHLIATYDPFSVWCKEYGGGGREIVLNDFDGHQGLTMRLPADEQVRIFVLRETTKTNEK